MVYFWVNFCPFLMYSKRNILPILNEWRKQGSVLTNLLFAPLCAEREKVMLSVISVLMFTGGRVLLTGERGVRGVLSHDAPGTPPPFLRMEGLWAEKWGWCASYWKPFLCY